MGVIEKSCNKSNGENKELFRRVVSKVNDLIVFLSTILL